MTDLLHRSKWAEFLPGVVSPDGTGGTFFCVRAAATRKLAGSKATTRFTSHFVDRRESKFELHAASASFALHTIYTRATDC